MKILKEKKSNESNTIKYLWINKEKSFETVFFEYNGNGNLCVSSQAGCKFGCKFCLTGKQKFRGNLSAEEIANQYLMLKAEMISRVNDIVFMGMGEPLDNIQNVLNSMKLMRKYNSNLKFEISTIGPIDGINELIETNETPHLFLSLHAPSDIKRREIMPIGEKYTISDTLVAVKNYIKKTNRKVGIRYLLLNEFNDSKKDCKDLINLLDPNLHFVHLLFYNETDFNNYSRADDERSTYFETQLKKSGFEVFLDKSKGQDIGAACGQLMQKNQ